MSTDSLINEVVSLNSPLVAAKLRAAIDRAPAGLPPVPWRDPHSVPKDELALYIKMLEKACAEQPTSADLRTCLGMAHAMNYDPNSSMVALQEAVRLDGTNFFAQLKYAELLYRLRIASRAEVETVKALELAGSQWELSLARKQLQEIRRIRRKGMERPDWNRSLRIPLAILAGMFLVYLIATKWPF